MTSTHALLPCVSFCSFPEVDHPATARDRPMRLPAATLLALCLLFSRVEAQTGPSTVGEWSAPVSLPIVTIHMQVLPDGKVLGWGNPGTRPKDGGAPVRLWDPSAAQPVFEEAANPFVDIYC